MQPYFSWSVLRTFFKHFIMMIHKFTKLVFMGWWKFPHVRAIENFAIEEIFYWIVGWRGMLLTFLIFFNWSTAEPPNYMPYHTINYHYKPRRQRLLLKWLFWPKPWHYYHLPKFMEKFLIILIRQWELFPVLDLGRNRIYMLTYSVVKFYLLLGSPTP